MCHFCHWYCCRPGSRLAEVNDVDEFKGQPLVGSRTDFTKLRCRVVDSLVASLERRFEDVADGVLRVAKIASLRSWPKDESIDGKKSM